MQNQEKQNIVVPKDFLDHLSKTNPNKWKLIVNPEEYIKDAISCLELQKNNCKSKKRLEKICGRLNVWKKELESITIKPEAKDEEQSKTN